MILIANQAADYQGDFEAFTAAVKAQSIRTVDGALHFATIAFYGPSRPGQVGGQTVNLRPPRGYDSPFIRSDWNSGLIHICKGKDTEILDFRGPRNPIRMVGVPVTAAFPPGMGTDSPIIFSQGSPPILSGPVHWSAIEAISQSRLASASGPPCGYWRKTWKEPG